MTDRLAYRTQPHYVYRLLGKRGRLIYIGCTMDLERRLRDHRKNLRFTFAKFDTLGPFDFATARRIERELIQANPGVENIEWTPGFRRGYSPTGRRSA